MLVAVMTLEKESEPESPSLFLPFAGAASILCVSVTVYITHKNLLAHRNAKIVNIADLEQEPYQKLHHFANAGLIFAILKCYTAKARKILRRNSFHLVYGVVKIKIMLTCKKKQY
jgi:hypothetical protein